jgi:hypothetical protein
MKFLFRFFRKAPSRIRDPAPVALEMLVALAYCESAW